MEHIRAIQPPDFDPPLDDFHERADYRQVSRLLGLGFLRRQANHVALEIHFRPFKALALAATPSRVVEKRYQVARVGIRYFFRKRSELCRRDKTLSDVLSLE